MLDDAYYSVRVREHTHLKIKKIPLDVKLFDIFLLQYTALVYSIYKYISRPNIRWMINVDKNLKMGNNRKTLPTQIDADAIPWV